MNGLNFGMEGPQITGWWYNPKTGDRFNALDTYFEDNNLLIKTSDGRILNYNQIQNYVRVEDPKYIPNKESSSHTKEKIEEIPPEVLAEIDNDNDNDLLIPEDNIYGSPVKQLSEPRSTTTLSPAVQDFAIIDRALSGKDTPIVIGSIEWKGFPKREIEMLVDVMQIPEQEIIQYYINSISLDSLRDMVSQSIERYIKDALNVGVDTALDQTSITDFTPMPALLKKKKENTKTSIKK